MHPPSRSIFILACLLLAALLTPTPPTTGARPLAADTGTTVYLPLVAHPLMPLGIVTGPAELSATLAQAGQGLDPGYRAIKSLLQRADKGLLGVPCATAFYTTTMVDCLNAASEYSYALALAYQLTGDSRYSARAAEYLRAWSGTLVAIDSVDDQPQLDWSRMAPAMVWGADLLEGSPSWSAADRAQLSAMLVNIVLPMGRQAAQRWNNWADAGNLLRLSIAVYAGLPDERAAAIADWKLRLDGLWQPGGGWLYGMLPDGSLAEENRRDLDGLSYNQGALSLKTVFAEILRRRGDPSLYAYRTPRGVGLKNGWDFLAPQVVNANVGICTWPYTASRCVSYANKSGWEIAYAYWHSPAYLGPIALHRPYPWSNWADPGYSTVLFGAVDLGGG